MTRSWWSRRRPSAALIGSLLLLRGGRCGVPTADEEEEAASSASALARGVALAQRVDDVEDDAHRDYGTTLTKATWGLSSPRTTSRTKRKKNDAALEMLLKTWASRERRQIRDGAIDAEALFWTGWALRRRGATDASSRRLAVAFFRRAIIQAPAHAVAQFYLGDALVDVGLSKSGAFEMRAALTSRPSEFDSDAFHKLRRAEALAALTVSRTTTTNHASDNTSFEEEEEEAASPGVVAVWDGALSARVYEDVFEEASYLVEYLSSETSSGATSLWHPLVFFFDDHCEEDVCAAADPVNYERRPIERAVVEALEPLVASVVDDVKKAVVGVEVWARHQHADKAVEAHYDLDVTAARRGETRLPLASSILYLSDHGGATFVLEDDAQREQKQAFVFPRRNRFAVFDGRLLHGVLPFGVDGDDDVDDDDRPRITLLVNWWAARPLAPQCESAASFSAFAASYEEEEAAKSYKEAASDSSVLSPPPEPSEEASSEPSEEETAAAPAGPRRATHDPDPNRRACTASLSPRAPSVSVPCPEDARHHPAFFASL